jgi:hypothetical protein
MRLRGRRLFAGHGGLGDGPFHNRPDRCACDAIEHIRERLLRHHRHSFDRSAVDHEVHEHRRGCRVVVPQSMVHELIVPDDLARFRVETDQTFRVEIVAVPVTAVVIVGGCPRYPAVTEMPDRRSMSLRTNRCSQSL